MNEKFYLQVILENCPRLFSAINQNQFSQNYGCLDRDFWHYKIEKDFPSSIFQTGALSLALLYKNNFPGNIYYHQQKVLELSLAAIYFWTKTQHSDGSFAEWYPGERSYVATAFTSYAISETVLILAEDFPKEKKIATFEVLERAEKWLVSRPDRLVLNHTAGAIIALYNLYLLTGKREFRQATQNNLKILLDLQFQEGWFSEYGGADLGYLSLTVDFLAKYYQKSQNKKVLESLKKAVDFMSFFVHSDGSFGGEYGSRGTKFLIPCGLEILSSQIPQAKQILGDWIPFNSFDDRYLIFFFLGNWIQAYLESQISNRKTQNYNLKLKNNHFDKNFPEAGIRVVKNKNYYLIVNFKKNGVIKVFKNKKLVFSDTGWWGRLTDGRIISSQWFNLKQNGLLIKTQFCQIEEPLLGAKIIFLRLFNYTLGQVGFLSRLLTWWLKRKYLTTVLTVQVFLKREIVIQKDKILVEDEISLGRGVFLDSLIRTTNLCQKYTPTSSFFTVFDLPWEKEENFAKILNKKRKIRMVKTI